MSPYRVTFKPKAQNPDEGPKPGRTVNVCVLGSFLTFLELGPFQTFVLTSACVLCHTFLWLGPFQICFDFVLGSLLYLFVSGPLFNLFWVHFCSRSLFEPSFDVLHRKHVHTVQESVK